MKNFVSIVYICRRRTMGVPLSRRMMGIPLSRRMMHGRRKLYMHVQVHLHVAIRKEHLWCSGKLPWPWNLRTLTSVHVHVDLCPASMQCMSVRTIIFQFTTWEVLSQYNLTIHWKGSKVLSHSLFPVTKITALCHVLVN